MNTPERCFCWQQNMNIPCKGTTVNCNGYDVDCPFYKTPAKYEADKQAAFERIASLPADVQIYISKTYYCGQTPWLGVNNA